MPVWAVGGGVSVQLVVFGCGCVWSSQVISWNVRLYGGSWFVFEVTVMFAVCPCLSTCVAF